MNKNRQFVSQSFPSCGTLDLIHYILLQYCVFYSLVLQESQFQESKSSHYSTYRETEGPGSRVQDPGSLYLNLMLPRIRSDIVFVFHLVMKLKA